ncbi:hypothetical protein CDAR_375611 [Caerostris darwini]|uniref:Uncharacterized protein n=1 Tax=Caerostris darwini TaxID=1538125 RepID=A0AAV4S3I2_9ARAC|nr:hypothetical protein CDAR_375611 [Caerostris darwini]
MKERISSIIERLPLGVLIGGRTQNTESEPLHPPLPGLWALPLLSLMESSETYSFFVPKTSKVHVSDNVFDPHSNTRLMILLTKSKEKTSIKFAFEKSLTEKDFTQLRGKKKEKKEKEESPTETKIWMVCKTHLSVTSADVSRPLEIKGAPAKSLVWRRLTSCR